jgi:hypothetical protein
VGGVVETVDGFDFGDGEVVISVEVVEAVEEEESVSDERVTAE